jgi:hypothetical protein
VSRGIEKNGRRLASNEAARGYSCKKSSVESKESRRKRMKRVGRFL